MIRYNPKRTGYCHIHTDWSNHSKRLTQYNRTVKQKPKHLHRRAQNEYTVDCICKVCGKPFKARLGTVKYRPNQDGFCCSSYCVGVNAAQQTPKKDTSIERAIEQALVERKWHYQKQVPFCGLTIADFYLPTYNVVIYCDGEYWHGDSKSIERDAKQNTTLRAKGYKVYRFSESSIIHSPHHCLDQINLSQEPLFRQLSLPICEM